MADDLDIEAVDRLFALVSRLRGSMETYLADHELTPARAELLLVLRSTGPLVQRRLSELLHCTPRHVTGLVDAAESSGLVQREAHPSDRRAVMVTLTQHGSAVVDEVRAQRRAGARTMFAGLAEGDLQAFIAVADHLLSFDYVS